MNAVLDSPMAHRLALALLHFLWQGALLGLAAWGALSALRRSSPQARYLVGCSFLLLCLAASVLTFWVAGREVQEVVPQAAYASLPAGSPQHGPAAAVPEGRAFALPLIPGSQVRPALPWVLLLWSAGVAFMWLRTAGGWIWLMRLKASAKPVEEPAWMGELLRRSGLRNTIRLLESARVPTPMCVGILRPVILLPLGFLTGIDPVAAEAVLAHEFAHIRRMDALVNGLQCAVESVFFYHPAVWWISRRIRIEREHCCDDAAVLACGDAVLYAETLCRLDDFRNAPTLGLRAQGGNLMERLRRLLNAAPPDLRIASPGLSLLAALALVGPLPVQVALAPSQPPSAPAVAMALPASGNGPVRPEPEPDAPAITAPSLAIPDGASRRPESEGSSITWPQQAPSTATSREPQPAPPRTELKAEELPVWRDTTPGALLLPSRSAVITDAVPPHRANAYLIKIPAWSSATITASSQQGNAYMRVNTMPSRGVRFLRPMNRLVITNASDTEQTCGFSVYFVPLYGGPRDISIRQEFGTLPPSH